MLLNAKKKTGKHKMGEGNARVQPEGMTSEYRPKGGESEAVNSEGKALQVEGRVRGQVLRQKHKRCAGGNQGARMRGEERERRGRLGAGSS